MHDNTYSRIFPYLKLTPSELKSLAGDLRTAIQQWRAPQNVPTVNYPGECNPKYLVELSGEKLDVRYIISFNKNREPNPDEDETKNSKFLLHPTTKEALNPDEVKLVLDVWQHCSPFQEIPFTVMKATESLFARAFGPFGEDSAEDSTENEDYVCGLRP